ncbi:MAG: metallophosphoesterase [Candidatus Aenigmarchaeota archaeon]|nr:metallophosphoesterase [Candidatus Aenigmarchaeota archaeon]
MNNKKIAWTTDLHLNFLRNQDLEKFINQINKISPDILLIGGDIAEAPNITHYLKRLEQSLDSKIYFVLGNHDFYNGSLSKVRKEMHKLSSISNKLFFLDDIPYIELTKDVALVGHSSWADGRLGNYDKSQVMLNDYILIKEFKGLTKAQRLQKLHELGDDAAAQLKENIETALKHYNKLICLTHVPPFKESCWHEGKISDDNYLPHFTCKAVGDTIRSIMESRPDSYLTILCGHTHSSGRAKILKNLEVITGSAEYGQSKIQQMIYL